MKYQSEIIHEILEQRGHGKSSLHYQSECIETWLEEVKGSYPKLTEYQAEWLNYMLENPLGEFPYVALIDVTGATVNNVVPYAYKSAILKGQTLVNIVHEDIYMDTVKLRSANYTLNGVKPNTNYLVKYTVGGTVGGRLALGFLGSTTWSSNLENQERSGTIILNSGLAPIYFRIIGVPGVDSFTNDDVQVNIIEYQQGMENWDISYFEGMQSVKMPVLYTIGSNIFDSSKVKDLDSTWKEPFEPTTQLIRCNPNTKYYYNAKSFDHIILYDENKNNISTITVWHTEGIKSFTTSSNCFFLGFTARKNAFDSINEHFISTNNYYEPYKSNILTVNENVTLRSNGNVYDELDLLTGKLTQHIDEDGSVLTQEVVKTVELSITDESGNKIEHFKPIEGTMHIQTDGEPIKPTVSMEIPVEAIAQNLASFIGEE